jgi:hypothetical protein
VKPLVDGFFVSGYSVFRRKSANHTTVEREQGRLVEYAVTPSLVCRDSGEFPRCYVPVKTLQQLHHGDREEPKSQDKQMDNRVGTFSWNCEELSFANLEREWGDIGVTEYAGQKVVVFWRRGEVDIAASTMGNNKDESREIAETITPSPDLPVFVVSLCSVAEKPEIKVYRIPGFSLQIDLLRAAATQVDDVTVSFEGQAKVLQCEATFEFLVRTYAQSLEPVLRLNHELILKTRPLLMHEQAFSRDVRKAACSPLPH